MTAAFMQQFESARESVIKTAAALPHIFPEWQALQAKQEELARVQRECDALQAVWDKKRGVT